jgi:hypothetical protein
MPPLSPETKKKLSDIAKAKAAERRAAKLPEVEDIIRDGRVAGKSFPKAAAALGEFLDARSEAQNAGMIGEASEAAASDEPAAEGAEPAAVSSSVFTEHPGVRCGGCRRAVADRDGNHVWPERDTAIVNCKIGDFWSLCVKCPKCGYETPVARYSDMDVCIHRPGEFRPVIK